MRRLTKSKVRKESLKAASKKKRHREKWSNRTCAQIGFYNGRGETSVAIGEKVSLSPASVRHMTAQWGLPKTTDDRGRGDLVAVPVILGKAMRAELAEQGKKRCMDIEQVLRRIVMNVKRDDLWKEVLDD